MSITKKSSILPWSIENIINSPAGTGVYVLRDATSIERIIYIGSTDNLERRLKEHFLSKDIPNVLYFDWYETDGIISARDVEKKWVDKYHPEFNVQDES